ncbi:MAG: TIGR03546 family protein [Gammaproteobacteria bacterium]|nr:TIGR03546 family protein [Gammaproteobacteria bacterium]
MWEPLLKFIKLLNSEQAPHQLSLGLAFALIVGFTPTLSLHNLLVLFLLLMLRANISAFLLGWAIFSLLGLLLDPLFHLVGQNLLSQSSLHEMWTGMYNNSFWRLSHFNNTILLGSLLISVLAFIPFFFLSNRLIRLYRERMQERFKTFSQRFTKLFKIGQFASRFSR